MKNKKLSCLLTRLLCAAMLLLFVTCRSGKITHDQTRSAGNATLASARSMDNATLAGDTSPALLMVEAKRKIYHPDGTRTYTDYQPFPTRTVSSLPGYKAPDAAALETSKYGGWKAHRETATGFFHVQKIGDRWWGIDPDGYRYINIALNSVSPGNSERNRKALKDKFKDEAGWILETIRLLEKNGFNCAGSWSDVKNIRKANIVLEKPFAYTINWNFMAGYGRERGGTFQQPGHTGYPNDAIFVFEPGFEAFCDRHAQKLLETKDDPNLFGHFSDNEMPFKIKALDNFLSLPKGDYGLIAAEEWLKKRGKTRNNITLEDREAFMAYVGDRYFDIVGKAIRKYDPNHLFIGSRFYGEEKHHEQFMRAVGKHLDIISCNYYDRWTPVKKEMDEWAAWTGKPFIITEYYTKGEDSGMPNQSGAGWIVKTQRDRGLFYQNYNLALIESGNCVGWHYFKYQDNDPTAKGADPSNIDANKGIVNNEYEPWAPMMDLMAALNRQVYALVDYFDRIKAGAGQKY